MDFVDMYSSVRDCEKCTQLSPGNERRLEERGEEETEWSMCRGVFRLGSLNVWWSEGHSSEGGDIELRPHLP